MVLTISRAQYVATYGPTVGDKVRLGDTNLWATIEQDLLTKGDECKFGGGKSVRDGMAQSGTATRDNPNVLDFVITNVMIIDAKLGIIKAILVFVMVVLWASDKLVTLTPWIMSRQI